MYYRNKKTGAVFQSSKDKPDCEKISQAEYDRASESCAIGATIKPIFAKVPVSVFDSFYKRCKAEGVSIGDALAMLVTQYAHGAVLTQVSKKAVQSFRYIDEVRQHPAEGVKK